MNADRTKIAQSGKKRDCFAPPILGLAMTKKGICLSGPFVFLHTPVFCIEGLYSAPPIPFLIGTFGAIIKMKPPIPDRRSLIDIGASGPISGFVIAVIAAIIGLNYSEIKSVKEVQEGLSLGSSILFYLLTKIVLNIDPDKYEIVLHPVAFAGWIGLLVTSLIKMCIIVLTSASVIPACPESFSKRDSRRASLAGMTSILL